MKLTQGKIRRQAGVTLIEVMLASSLLLIGVVPILKAMTSAQGSRRVVERKTMSLALAQGKIREIRSKTYYQFTIDFDENGTSLNGAYLCNVSDDGHALAKTISVSVGYDGDGNGSLSSAEVLITLTTLMANRS